MTSQYQISGRRPQREVEHALTITTRNIYALMEEARSKKQLMSRATSDQSKANYRRSMEWCVRTARDKSRHALTLRRLLAGYTQ